MSSTKEFSESKEVDQNSTNWGYELVCSKLSEVANIDPSGTDDLMPLLNYVSGHETCFLEFKATPFKPSKEVSISNPFGYHCEETSDDYAWNVVKSIIALANSAGGAVILGITDKGHEPIPEICEKHWEHDRWDGFSRNLPKQIFHRSYEIIKGNKPIGASSKTPSQSELIDIDCETSSPSKLTIDLDDNACERLENLCTITCHKHKGHLIPVILVKAVKDSDDLIFAKERANDMDFLLVREKGDVGETIKLTGRDIRHYSRPDEATYTASRDTAIPRAERPFHNLIRVPNFVGRTDDLNQLNRSFISDARIQWIFGNPGIGKTAFIQKYIGQYCGIESESLFDFAFFISAKGQTCAQAICQLCSYARTFENFCGIKLDENQRNPFDEIFKSPEDAKPRLFKSWARRIIEKLNTYRNPGKILIVLDNVDNPEFLNEDQINWILDDALNGRVRFCITSRAKPEQNDRTSPFPLSPLSVRDAVDILDQRKSTQQERDSAEEIVKLVSCNAWAINLIATQIENDQEPNPYARKLSELRDLGFSSTLTDRNSGEDLKTLYEPSIARLRAESTRGNSAISLLALSAWFLQDGIPEDYLKTAFNRYLYHTQNLRPKQDRDDWKLNIGTLLSEGLIQWSPENKTYNAQLFGQDVLWTLPETYHAWQYVFETVKEELYAESSNDDVSFSQWHWQLINFIDLTAAALNRDDPSNGIAYKNATEIVKWIASEPRWRTLLRKAVENFGNAKAIRRICANLFQVAKLEYNAKPRSNEAAKHYLFFLSIQKVIAATWKQDIKQFKEISQSIRTVFEKLTPKKEEEEIEFAKELIADVKQYDKLYPYTIIEKDLNKALELILKYKDRHLGLLVKSYLEIANVELEFKKYRKVRKSLRQLLAITRRADKNLPEKNLLMFCKEQLAFMHLCKCASSTGAVTRWYHYLRASKRYNWLIKELSFPASEEHESQKAPRELLLFKSHYFLALTLLQKGEAEAANTELDTAFKMCDQIFNPALDDGISTSSHVKFNNLRIKSGIYRLKKQLEEAQRNDLDALSFYKQHISCHPNLDLADLLDDYGNTHALRGNFEKAIDYVKESLEIRGKLLPATHIKIFNSFNRLAYLYGINAMINGKLAHDEITKLIDDRGRTGDGEIFRTSSKTILNRLKKITKFGNESKETFLDQLRDDEQREECERVRMLIADIQEKLFDRWFVKNN